MHVDSTGSVWKIVGLNFSHPGGATLREREKERQRDLFVRVEWWGVLTKQVNGLGR